MRVLNKTNSYTNKELKKLNYDQIFGVYVEYFKSYSGQSNQFYDKNYSKFVFEFVKNNTRLCILLNMLYFRDKYEHTFIWTVINEYKESLDVNRTKTL